MRTSRLVLRAYPRQWRKRYGADLLATIEQSKASGMPIDSDLALLRAGLSERARRARRHPLGLGLAVVVVLVAIGLPLGLVTSSSGAHDAFSVRLTPGALPTFIGPLPPGAGRIERLPGQKIGPLHPVMLLPGRRLVLPGAPQPGEIWAVPQFLLPWRLVGPREANPVVGKSADATALSDALAAAQQTAAREATSAALGGSSEQASPQGG
jgi:hypothetical protein